MLIYFYAYTIVGVIVIYVQNSIGSIKDTFQSLS